MPLFDGPQKPMTILKWFFGVPGFLVPWYSIYLVVTLAAFFLFTPEMARMETLQPGWALEILARNIALVTIFTGGLHLWLSRVRAQGRKTKYSDKWLAEEDKRFHFHNQVHDNVVWSMIGTLIWTGYEVLLWWGYANSALPYTDNAIWFVAWMLLMPFWRNFHFYWIHRLIHWPPLYRTVHYLHHKNVNVGPWGQPLGLR